MAVAGVFGVLLLSLLVSPWFDGVAPVLLLAVVVYSGWSGGLIPSIVAGLTGFLVLDYFFEYPAYSFEITDGRTAVDMGVFLLIALLLGVLNGRLRESLRRTQQARAEAESAIRARDDALAVISHDLRTPVTAIQASVAALLGDEQYGSEPPRQRLLHNIEAEVALLDQFIVDALVLGRLEAGVAPRLVDCDAGEIASVVVDRCLPVLAGRDVQFNIPDDLPEVNCDPTLLERSLGNLLLNAAYHTPAGTPVRLDCRRVGECLRLEVSDAGPGIPPEARERVFNKFERLDSTARGAGLGLALARAALEAQNGRLWVEESDWGGARFVLLLPLATSASTADKPAIVAGASA
jgi:two-component system sensor histidine kinase KdpD